MKQIQILAGFLFCCFVSARAQSGTLSLEEAITIGLKNNFSIQIAKNDLQVAVNNNSLGNAGFLPTLNLSGGAKQSVNGNKSEDQSGVSTESKNQRTITANAAVALDWTLFDGFGMFIKKEKLSS